jgi:ATP-dependent DNA ligase
MDRQTVILGLVLIVIGASITAKTWKVPWDELIRALVWHLHRESSRSLSPLTSNSSDKKNLSRRSRFKGLEIDTCPFANLPEKKRTQWALTKEEMKNCVWLKPELVAQIEFTEWTPDGHLRHSRFVGLREDKAAREVVREARNS